MNSTADEDNEDNVEDEDDEDEDEDVDEDEKEACAGRSSLSGGKSSRDCFLPQPRPAYTREFGAAAAAWLFGGSSPGS